MPNPSPGGNWKHNQPAATPGKSAPVPAPNASRRSWMPGTTAPTTTQKKTGRGKRIILASLFAGALVSLIVVLFYLFSPQKAVEFVLVAPDAPDSLALPENIASVNGLSAVSDWAKSRGSKTRLAAPLNETTPEGWKSKLNKAAPAIVLYFAAPGGADSDGPFLWMIPAEARNPTDAHKLRVKDILDRLAGMPTSQPKLLVFDCAQHHSSWVHGALHNDFARSLKGLDSAIEKVPGLAVFCAADEHERSWVSEEWRMSVFNYYFTEALKGAAGQANQRINGRDLAEYVSREQVGTIRYAAEWIHDTRRTRRAQRFACRPHRSVG